MSTLNLDAIRERRRSVEILTLDYPLNDLIREDIPALISEVEALREQKADLQLGSSKLIAEMSALRAWFASLQNIGYRLSASASDLRALLDRTTSRKSKVSKAKAKRTCSPQKRPWTISPHR